MLPAQLRTVLAQQPLGLVFDIDGTLSPIAPTPDAATLYPGVADLLVRAQTRAQVAIMTGRAVDDGAAMVNVEGLTYIGTHGLEWSAGLPETHEVQLEPTALPYVEAGKQLLDLAEQHFGNGEGADGREGMVGARGIIVQRKRVGGSLHYRLAANPEQARQQIFALLEEPARRLHMRLGEGKSVVEVLAPLAINKGYALRRYVEMYKLRGIVFAGDDRTDLDAVMEIVRLRQEGYGAFSIVVRHHDTLPELLAHADYIVDEVEGMAHLLAEMVEIVTTP